MAAVWTTPTGVSASAKFPYTLWNTQGRDNEDWLYEKVTAISAWRTQWASALINCSSATGAGGIGTGQGWAAYPIGYSVAPLGAVVSLTQPAGAMHFGGQAMIIDLRQTSAFIRIEGGSGIYTAYVVALGTI